MSLISALAEHYLRKRLNPDTDPNDPNDPSVQPSPLTIPVKNDAPQPVALSLAPPNSVQPSPSQSAQPDASPNAVVAPQSAIPIPQPPASPAPQLRAPLSLPLVPQGKAMMEGGAAMSPLAGVPPPDSMQPPAPQTVASESTPPPVATRALPPSTPPPMSLDDRTAAARTKVLDAQLTPVKKESKWKDVLAYAAQAANNIFNPQNQMKYEGWGKLQHDKAVEAATRQFTPLAALQSEEAARQKAQADVNLRNAQTDNIYQDNAQKAKDSAALDDYRKGEQSRKSAADSENEKRRFLDGITRRGYFDPSKASPADVKQLAQYGLKPEDIGNFDNRDPVLKQVDGATYKFNRNTGSFDQTDLPTDQSKETVDFTVTGQDGQPHTYKVSQEKAAGFQTQMNALGQHVQLAKELQSNQQNFQASENQKGRDAAAARLQQQLSTASDEKKQQMVDAAVERWKSNYRRANNGADPDHGAVLTQQELIKNAMSFSNQPIPQ